MIAISLLMLLASPALARMRLESRCAPGKQFEQLVHPGGTLADRYAAQGAMFEEKKDFRCASEAFAHAAALEPSSARLAYAMGTALYANRQMTASEEALRRSVALDPSFAEARLALGVVDHDLGKPAEALRQWEAALRIDPGSVTTIDWIAKARIEAGQYTIAAELLRNAPADEELTLDLIVADSKAGLFDEGTSRAEKALELHPEWRRVYVALSTIYAQRNRLEDATSVLHKAVALAPGDTSLMIPYLRILLVKGDSVEAQKLASALLKERPHDYDVLYLNGLLEREQAKYDLARRDLEAAVALRPGVYDVEYNLGFVLGKLHHLDEAKAQLQKAIAVDAFAPEAHFQLAAVLRQAGDTDASQHELETYRKLMQDREALDEGITLTTKAAQKLQERDVPAAVALYKQAVEKLPDDAQAYYRLAMALDHAEAWQDEKAALQKALDLHPGLAAAQNQMGYVAARTGESARAETYFRQAVASAPQFAEAESNLGSLLASENRNSEAEEHFKAALAADPRFTDAWINLAATLAGASRFDEARKAIEAALQIDPSNTDAAQLLQSLPPIH